MKAEYPPSPGTSVIITDGTKNTTCYAFDKGEHGWCQVYSILAKSIFGEEKFRFFSQLGPAVWPVFPFLKHVKLIAFCFEIITLFFYNQMNYRFDSYKYHLKKWHLCHKL